MCKVQGRASFTISKVIAYVCYKLIKMAKRAGQIGVVRLRFCLKAVNNAPNICHIREIKINFLFLEFGPSKSFGWFCATDHFASWINGISDKKLVQARTDPKVEKEKIKRVLPIIGTTCGKVHTELCWVMGSWGLRLIRLFSSPPPLVTLYVQLPL